MNTKIVVSLITWIVLMGIFGVFGLTVPFVYDFITRGDNAYIVVLKYGLVCFVLMLLSCLIGYLFERMTS